MNETDLSLSPNESPPEEDAPAFDSENVDVLTDGTRTIYLIGTAHVSDESVREVNDVISAIQPDTVCIELCQTRFDALQDEERWRKLGRWEGQQSPS